MVDSSDHDLNTANGGKASPSSGLEGLNPLGLMDGVLGGQATDWEPPAPESLEEVFQGFRDFRFIDRGGMGAVYAAVQESLNRRVAVKVLPPELVEDEVFMQRFKQEAHLLARLQHPHIVSVYDFGVTSTGYHYIVMEFVEGVSLMEILRREQPTPSRAVTMVCQVCEALEYAHGRGVIHRDIKPGNILIDERGLVRVADFGLAKNQMRDQSTTTGSRTRGFIGTISYASPEQRRKDARVDLRSDLFSLGVTLYELLTGCLPVGVFELASKKAGTPLLLDKIIHRCLQEDPKGRYQSAADLRRDLAKVMMKMGTPLIQRTIISKPIISMVSSVIVGMGFIYLLDALDRMTKPLTSGPRLVLENAGSGGEPQAVQAEDLLMLDEEWCVLKESWRWETIPTRLKGYPGWELAEIHTEAEHARVVKLLSGVKFDRPLSLGAVMDSTLPEPEFRWLSGGRLTFDAWMPAPEGPALILTEIQAKNLKTLQVGEESPDWIEVYNPGPKPVDITGYHLRHMYGGAGERLFVLGGWIGPETMPAKLSPLVQPGEYRVICCSQRLTPDCGYTVIGFRLEGGMGRVEWYDPRGRVVQKFDKYWRGFHEDNSIARGGDDESWGWALPATPGRPNGEMRSRFFPPLHSQAPLQKLLMLPKFGGRWAACPSTVANHLLLRRTRPK